MLENMSNNQRVLLATVLSLIVFMASSYFYAPQPQASQSQASQPTPVQTAQNTPSAPSKPRPTQTDLNPSTLLTIKGEKFDIFIDNLGRISQVILEDEKYIDEKGEQIRLFNQKKLPKPLEIRFSDQQLNFEAFKVPYTYQGAKELKLKDKLTLTLIQNLSKAKVIKEITFYSNGHYETKIKVEGGVDYFISPGYRPDVRVDGYTLHGALIKEADGTITIIEDGDAKGVEKFPKAQIASAFDRYYATFFYDFEKGLDVVVSKDEESNPILFVKGSPEFEVKGYFGPKEYETLKAIDPRLTDVIEYGFFTFIAKPLFKALLALYHLVGNWGWAIVLLTIIIRILLFPLTLKGMLSMQKLKDLAPKIKEIQQKYKGDPQRMNAAMMELYRKHNANPMGGCLPMLIQIPIFFAIYRVLLNAIELKGAPWILWIKDLSQPDPYFVLPILMGVTMYLHQKLTPTTITDPTQKKIFEWLPVVFTFFFIAFPAGLTLYWFTNNILSIIQQLIVNKIFESKKVGEKGKIKDKE